MKRLLTLTVMLVMGAVGMRTQPPTQATRQLMQSSSFSSVTSFDQYDPLGRILHSTQTTPGQSALPFSYTYNLAGAVTSDTNPSGLTVTTCYDVANRPSGVSATGTCGDGAYASGVLYASQGAVNQITLGNGIVETINFNNRLQVSQIDAGGLSLTYNYGSSNNNGDLVQATIGWPGLTPINQFYQYDQFNHLHLASENPLSSSATTCSGQGSFSWCERYLYDAFANRSIAESSLGYSPLSPVSFSSSTNQNGGTGWSYDASGNLKTDPLGTTYAYDGENRQIAAGSSTYAYDGAGRRVLRTVAGAQSTYAYDAFGNLAAEYGSSVQFSGTVYLTADHLGSTRMLASSSNTLLGNGTPPGPAGTAIECREYLPFGELVPVNSGSPRAGVGCFTTEVGVRQQFTGKERDAETGLDDFLTRYFSSLQGRFTSPDEPFADQHTSDPQSWNLYAYGRNNPLKYTDPAGRAVQVCLNGESGEPTTCRVMSDPQYAAAIAGNNPGINAPAAGATAGPGGGLAFGGVITCGGAVCGSATYQEESMQDTTGDLFALGQAVASVPSLIRGSTYLGRSLIRGVAGLSSKEAVTVAKVTVQDILEGAVREGGSRTQIYSKPGGFAQATKDFESLEGSAQTVGPVRIKDLPNGEGRAVLRKFSSDGRPTLEIQPEGGGYKGTAIRYNP